MVQVVKHQEQLAVAASLFHLHNEFQIAGDGKQARKALQLLRKWESGEFVVAFCGHFSAGKSSMINELMGQRILPASPIPTSANLVSVKAGEEHAEVYYRKEKLVRYEAPYDYEQIKEFCVDGDEVESIHLSISTSTLPNDVVVMDTPGIDSTDDAHRVSTESALHLADVIFYVMDYNHVQAELNFQFTKELQESNKELFLIINQIDKHRDDQLSFAEFKESVQQAFLKWNVKPKGIFYTSLKDKNHPQNDLSYVKNVLLSMMKEKENRRTHMIHSAQMLIHDHLHFLEEYEEEKLVQYDKWRSQLTKEEYQSVQMQIESLKQKQMAISEYRQQLYETYNAETSKIMNNANLTPYEMREKTKSFLETTKSDFKVGMLFAKKKTEEARRERLAAFYDDVKERVTSQLQWHLQQYIQQVIKQEKLDDAFLMNEAQHFEIPLDAHDLVDAVKSGATINGDYVLTYTRDLADGIKKKTTRLIYELYTHIERVKQEEDHEQLLTIKQSLDSLYEFEEAYKQVEKMNAKLQNIKHKLRMVLQRPAELTSGQIIELSHLLQEEFVKGVMTKRNKEERQKASSAVQMNSTDAKGEVGTERALKDIETAINALSPFDQLHRFVTRLKEKREKLSNQTFTVALFGAFSAGKSSFANALIGETLLPVSPNPTTATINKIMPPTNQHQHKTATVLMKTKDQLLADINSSLQLFEKQVQTVEEALTIIPSLVAKEELQLHLSFLHAVMRGYDNVKEVIGSNVEVTMDQFQAYVAQEEKACFVQHINLYYDCELTRLGITLVDTPGADSINARHTGVAFEYIKNADAILFVTYYNHAFSKADREFLIQLGRVKDVFALDKMFFLLNAADLAQSDQELDLVKMYVKDQLEQYGIRYPRLYPISSLRALNNQQDEMFQPFKQAFYHFITNELTQLAAAAVYAEIKQALTVTNEIKQVQTKSADEKKRYIQSLHIKDEQVTSKLAEVGIEYEKQQLEREMEELRFYVKKRVLQRYDDFFKESFNPANLRDDKGNKNNQLQECLNQLIKAVAFDATQEVRATTLRVEAYIQKLIEDWHHAIVTKLQRYEETFHPSLPPMISKGASSLVTDCIFHDIKHLQKDLSLYKNNKSFFEKNEKAKMHESLKQKVEPVLDLYIQEQQAQLDNHYMDEITDYMKGYKQILSEEWHDYYKQLQAAVTTEFPIDTLNDTIEVLIKVLEGRKDSECL
ncbi:GTPase [Priestia megaterium]|nr:GTPase [Priestia megaterium]